MTTQHHNVDRWSPVPQPRTLSAEQINRWHADGFLVLDRFVDDETVHSLRAAYDDVLAHRTDMAGSDDRDLGGLTRQVMLPHRAHPTFDANPAIDSGLAMAAQLLGVESVVRTFDMLIYKPPGHPHPTPWHQDSAYDAQPFAPAGHLTPHHSVQFWLPLDDVDEDTGCMQFVPGHHRAPLLDHRVAAGDPDDSGRLLELVDPEAQLDLSTVHVAAMPAGGITMHSYGTPHYTGANRSRDRQRRSYIFNIAARPASTPATPKAP